MKFVLIFVLCFSLTACFLLAKKVRLGEEFIIKIGETVKVEGHNFQLKVIGVKIRDFFDLPQSSKQLCEFEFKNNDKTEELELIKGGSKSSTIVQGFNINLLGVDTTNSACRVIITKAE